MVVFLLLVFLNSLDDNIEKTSKIQGFSIGSIQRGVDVFMNREKYYRVGCSTDVFVVQ